MADVTDNVERPPLAETEILDLPPEILIEICEAILVMSRSDPESEGICDLINLGAACKTLNTLVRPVLYRHFDSTWLEMVNLPYHGLSMIDTPRFFKLLVCMKKRSATDLVRYADLDTITAKSSVDKWHMVGQAVVREPWIDSFTQILQSLEELGLKPEFPGKPEDFDEGNTITPLSVLVAIFISFFQNALALRLPVDSTTNLPLLGSESSCCLPYPAVPWISQVRGHGYTTGTEGRLDTTYLLGDNRENPPPEFPSLRELELSAAFPHYLSLKDQHVHYFASKSPHLRTLRLRNFIGLDENHRDFNLGSLTNITLLGCSLSYLDIRRLALGCPGLRKFKISQSIMWNSVRVVWDGKGEFSQTYDGQHPDDSDDEGYNSIGDMDSEAEEQYTVPHSSDMVSSSLVLQALTPLAESLESIFLGKCQYVRAGSGGLNIRRRKLDFSPFNRLQTLGIWTENLFQYRHTFSGHGRLKPVDDVFSEILLDCPTIKNLLVFNTRVWPTGGTAPPYYEHEGEVGIAVERALKRLSEDLMPTNSSEPTETSTCKVGPSLRLVRLCHRYESYDDDISPGFSSLHLHPVEEGATVMGEPVTELFIRSSESDADEKGESFWGLRPPKIDDSVVDRFRDRGVEFVNLGGETHGNQYEEIEKQFPYPAELDEILFDC
ncbi:hypothetical protein QBC37DRAFT_404053 [Rhypophila decipiens]|uniref:Uncharacterized protein n=1 Tax=Rhypophila decipiens TaxID=261697 RepID=A0AAN6Y1S0_9PEZI|nr:hypothetical protein QBC37DRAFT_404053 [Rhypophila decipiens]